MHKEDVFTKLIALYLLVGGVVCFLIFISKFGLIGILSFLLPAVITIIIQFYFVFSGVMGLLPIKTYIKKVLIISSLAIQSFQVVLLGVVFKNYFGPYLAIGFTDSPEFEFFTVFRLCTYLFANGLRQGVSEISLAINVVPLITLILYSLHRKR